MNNVKNSENIKIQKKITKSISMSPNLGGVYTLLWRRDVITMSTKSLVILNIV